MIRTESQWEEHPGEHPGEHSRDDTLRGEVLRALKINLSNYSYSSSDDIAMLLRTMFPDTAIASKFTCVERCLIMCFDSVWHRTSSQHSLTL